MSDLGGEYVDRVHAHNELRQINEELGVNDFDQPELEPAELGDFRHGVFQLVGHGYLSSRSCGTWHTFRICNRVELHNQASLDGENHRGKVFVKHHHWWCNKPSCPICFNHGWVPREAGKMEHRLEEASKLLGRVEHIVASVPVADYGLSFVEMRAKTVEALAKRGVVGGALIFHGFRFERGRGSHSWFWSPHWHILGFILGGYPCRGCKKVCEAHGCDKFEGRTRRLFQKDGFVVKVLGKRISVFWTSHYQLDHATLKVGHPRFHVITWFGNCSYRKLKVTPELRDEFCPLCKHELVDAWYFGSKSFVKDRSADGYEASFWSEYEENRRVVWVEKPKKYG